MPSKSFVAFEPLGVVLAVMPWNFPPLAGLPLRRSGTDGRQHWGFETRQQCPRLCAGNRGQVFGDAGYPENVFRTLV